MHPIERLRFVARATGAPVDDVVHEAAASLAGFSSDPVSLVTACRRLLDRHAAIGPVWWLCARTLLAPDPGDEAWRCHAAHHSDPTAAELTHALPEGARVVVVGWPDRLGAVLVPRGDLEVLVVDVAGDGPGFARALERADVPVHDVAPTAMAAAVAAADLVLLESALVGPEVLVAASGSWEVAAVARSAEVPVWVLGGLGTTMGSGLWPAARRRLEAPGRPPWEADRSFVPLDLVDRVAGPQGLRRVPDALATVDVPDVAELRR